MAEEITRADQLTRREFGKLIRTPKTWYWLVGGTIVTGLAFWFFTSTTGAVIGALVAFLIGLGITWGSAREKSEDAFYDDFAGERGFLRDDRQLGQLTPLLRKGDKRRTDETFTGQLNPQFQGSLYLWTYIVVTHDSKGNRQENPVPFTIVTVKLPELGGRLAELVVQKKAGFQALEKFEDAFRGNLERVKLESEALDDRFEIFVREDQDEVFIRRLFSPSFIVWLTEHPNRDFAFEFGSGEMVAYVKGYQDTDDELDRMIADSCELAARLHAEVAEG